MCSLTDGVKLGTQKPLPELAVWDRISFSYSRLMLKFRHCSTMWTVFLTKPWGQLARKCADKAFKTSTVSLATLDYYNGIWFHCSNDELQE